MDIEQITKGKGRYAIYYTLSEIGDTYSGLRGKSKTDFENGNARYITYKNIYNNLSVELNTDDYVKVSDNENQNYLKLGDILVAGSSENIEDSGMVSVVTEIPQEKIYLNSFCFGFRLKDEFQNKLLPGFSKHLFRSENFRKDILKCSFGVTRYNLSKEKFLNIKIPIPPTEIQKEIVNILDKFKELEIEMDTELGLRVKQRDGFKQKLLKFGENDKWEIAKNICDVEKGKTPIQKAEPGEYPLVVTAPERKSCSTYQFEKPAVCIPLVSSRGHGVASLNHVYYQEGKFALGNILCAMIPKDASILDAKFLYQYLEYEKDTVLVGLMKGGANVAMHKGDLENIKLPVVDINVQKKIVHELQVCDEIIETISEELKMRHKQYEYYRNKLLTFNSIQ